jgi:nucleoside-triphosphatase
MSIYIFTGEIKSGKTTRLQKFISGNPGTDGILAPVINGKKHLVRIKTNETKLLEHDGIDKSVTLTKIGSYDFIKSVFDWGQKELYDAYLQKPTWLIIDEIGPLELKGEALEPMVSKILSDEKRKEISIILVIRKTLIEKAIEHYKLHVNGFKFFTI